MNKIFRIMAVVFLFLGIVILSSGILKKLSVKEPLSSVIININDEIHNIYSNSVKLENNFFIIDKLQ